jgi:hypothetical protein
MTTGVEEIGISASSCDAISLWLFGEVSVFPMKGMSVSVRLSSYAL